jgi:predicted Zn-dependent peptidase
VYGTWSETSAYEHNSSWDFGAEVNEEKVHELFELIVDEVMQVKNGEISDEELDTAKSFALGQHQMGVQTVGRLDNWLSEYYFLDGRIEDFATQPDKINAVTRQKIVDVVNEFISTNCWGIGIYGNTNKALAEELRDKLAVIYK